MYSGCYVSISPGRKNLQWKYTEGHLYSHNLTDKQTHGWTDCQYEKINFNVHIKTLNKILINTMDSHKPKGK